MDSILTSIKKRLGITEDYTHFDEDVIMDINSVFSILRQLGVGPEEGYQIDDKSAKWQDFIIADFTKLEFVKTYVYLKVRLMFDPPQSSYMTDAINKQIAELEWRIVAETDY